MPEKKSFPPEFDLSDENLLKLHLELTRLAIRGHNITEGFLPPLPEHLEKRYLPKLILGNYNPSGAPEGSGAPGEESLKQYESEYEQWQTKQCERALNGTQSQIANIEREIETGKANRILNEKLDFYRALKTQIESWFDLNYIDIPPKAEVEPKKEEAPHEGEQRKSQRDRSQVSQFPVENGTRWDEVQITIISTDKLIIAARKKHKTYFYHEIGLSGRNPFQPGSLWDLLFLFAGKGGVLDRTVQSQLKGDTSLKKRISELRGRLGQIIPIDGDPIPFHPGGVLKGGVGGQIGKADEVRGMMYGGEYKTRFKIKYDPDREFPGNKPLYAPTDPEKLPDTPQETPDEPLMIPRRSRGVI